MIGDNQGDNGGPLTVVMEDRHILAGVVSLAWLGDCGGFEVVLLNIGSLKCDGFNYPGGQVCSLF